MPDPAFLLKASRPRFWLYLFGPFLIGLAAAATSQADFFRAESILFALYFLFPANLLIYGVNDIFDFETDRLNPKKMEYEQLVRPESHVKLVVWILFFNLPFLIAAVFLAQAALPSLVGFLFFSIFYSAPPIRAKAVPILDSAFNILYVFPAAFAYQLISGSFPPSAIMIAGGLWTMAMHAFSAVPDIDADREAKIHTVATFSNKNGTLLFCLSMYIASAILAFQYLGIAAIALGAVYVAIMLASFVSKNSDGVYDIYKFFPLVNAATGFILFWFVVLSNVK